MALTIKVLGGWASYALPKKYGKHFSLLLDTGKHKIWIDPSVQLNEDVDAIIITQSDKDHYLKLDSYLKKHPEVPVYSTKAIINKIITKFPQNLKVIRKPLKFNGLKIIFLSVPHKVNVPALALKIEYRKHRIGIIPEFDRLGKREIEYLKNTVIIAGVGEYDKRKGNDMKASFSELMDYAERELNPKRLYITNIRKNTYEKHKKEILQALKKFNGGILLDGASLIFNGETRKTDGLYLVSPHAILIYEGLKSIILKSRHFDIANKTFILCDDTFAYGHIVLEKPEEIDKEKFKEYADEHLVTEEEMKEWGWSFPLYAYKIKTFKPYDDPIPVKLPQGIQTFVKDVEQYFEKLHLEEFRNTGVDYDIKNIKERWREAIADLRYLGNCYSEDTEVLTKAGWKYFKDLTYDDELATLNLKTGELEYQKPEELYKFPYDGYLLNFEGKKVSILCTPEQKLLRKVRVSGKKESYSYWRFDFAKDLNIREIVFKRDAIWNCERPEYFELPAIEKGLNQFKKVQMPVRRLPFDKWVEFLAWYLAEGSTKLHGDYGRNGYTVRISQKKRQDYIKEIYDLCKSLGFNPKIDSEGVRIHDKQLAVYLKQFGTAKEKFVPDYVKDAPPDIIKRFLEIFIKADGYERDSEALITTSSKRLADDLQELSLKAGLTGNIRQEKWGGYTITLSKRTNATVRNGYKLVKYRGFVYDAKVPNSTLFIRRNGKAVWAGNSAYPRLKRGEKWGKWTLDDVLRYFAKLVDALRSVHFPIIPPHNEKLYREYTGKDPTKAKKSSYWQCYAEAEKYMQSKPPKNIKEAKEWDKKRKETISLKKKEEKPKIGYYSKAKPYYRGYFQELAEELKSIGWDKQKLLIDCKWDGLRMTIGKVNGKGFAYVDPDDVKQKSPNVSRRVPAIIKEIEDNFPDNTILDGEFLAIHPNGKEMLHRTVCNSLLNSKASGEELERYAIIVVFDIIFYDGLDLRNQPLHERLEYLSRLKPTKHIWIERISTSLDKKADGYICDGSDIDCIMKATDIIGNAKNGRPKFCAEGVMIKRLDGPYEYPQNHYWMKVKFYHEIDLRILDKKLVKGSKDTYNYYLGYDTPKKFAEAYLNMTTKDWYGKVYCYKNGKIVAVGKDCKKYLDDDSVTFVTLMGKSDNHKEETPLKIGDILRIAAEEVLKFDNPKFPDFPRYSFYIGRVLEPIPEKDVTDSIEIIDKLSQFEPQRIPVDELRHITGKIMKFKDKIVRVIEI